MLIGLGHQAEVGKDTAAEVLVREHGYRRIGFADKLKEFALAINPDLYPSVASNVRANEGVLRTLVARYGWDEAKSRYPKVRTYLQVLGVAAREAFGEGFWVGQALDSLVPLIDHDEINIVISDVRFVSEAMQIKQLGGVVVKVIRPGHGAVNDHISEHELDDWEFDYVLRNDGTKDDLGYEVGKMIKVLKILPAAEVRDGR